ncbi:GNAT family N-acetyltransferase [Candidatus Gracilibacteria bacterium]|nr:GNAT family N-acetyltransferase [Candidatus Gracilibacteria bacterium]
MQILHLRSSHIEGILALNLEFERYLDALSSSPRETFDVEKKREQLLKHAFGNKKSYSGYVAKIEKEIVGYAFYHSGFDPDEMQGKIIHLIDFFVSEKARRKGVGRALIEKLQSHEDSLGLYFGVWKKNIGAVEFYKKIGADWIDDVPFMKLLK